MGMCKRIREIKSEITDLKLETSKIVNSDDKNHFFQELESIEKIADELGKEVCD